MAMLKKDICYIRVGLEGKFDHMIVCMNQKNWNWLTYQVKIDCDCEYNVLDIYSADSLSTAAKPHLLNQYIPLKLFLVLNYLKLSTHKNEKMKQKFWPTEIEE